MSTLPDIQRARPARKLTHPWQRYRYNAVVIALAAIAVAGAIT